MIQLFMEEKNPENCSLAHCEDISLQIYAIPEKSCQKSSEFSNVPNQKNNSSRKMKQNEFNSVKGV